jgi:hypothetical protein
MNKFIALLLMIGNLSFINSLEFDEAFCIPDLGWDPFFTIAGLYRDEFLFARTINGIEYYEIKHLNELKINRDGFYTIKIFDDDCVVLGGGNYFFIHDLTDNRYSMYRIDKDYEKFQIDNDSDEEHLVPGARTKRIEKIIVNDVLVENTSKGRIVYTVDDMLKYYSRMLDGHIVCNPDAKPWATNKDPRGMTIDVEFRIPKSEYTRQNHIVILNGYANPLKRNLYKENRRIKKLQIESLDKDRPFSLIVSFDDEVMFKRIAFPENVNKVRLTILDYYEGSKYKDFCIQYIGTDFDLDYGSPFYFDYKKRAIKRPNNIALN